MPYIFRGVPEVVARTEEMGVAVNAACGEWANQAAATIERAAKQNAPVDTGQLRRSILTIPAVGGGGGPWVAYVYPSVVYGRRVELGFTGLDALGRYYSPDHPYNANGNPYLLPAIDAQSGPLGVLFVSMIAEAISVG